MKFLFIISMLLGLSAFASESKTVTFSYYNNNAYYACSYAEAQAVTIVKQLGGQVLSTQCGGGIEPGAGNFPLDMKVVFTQGDATGVSVKFHGWNDSCDFHVRLIDEVLKVYTHKAVQKQESCWDSQGNYSYQVQL